AGNCSAGTTCQFSHHLPEIGQGKPICQWFVKGNCRFGHKCALAHILPGQPISMDRKNKRSAQTAAREAAAAAASNNNNNNNNNNHPATSNSNQQSISSKSDLNIDSNQIKNSNHSKNSTLNHPSIKSTSKFSSTLDLNSNHSNNNHRRKTRQNKSLQLNPILIEPLNLNEDLQFGLPDDFITPNSNSLSSLTPNSSSLLNSINIHNPLLSSNQFSNPSPSLDHLSNHLNSSNFSIDHSSHLNHSIDISSNHSNHLLNRDQSLGPFAIGSPFSAPGSKSIFLPRIDSFGSEDGFPRSAPSPAPSPGRLNFLNQINSNHQDDIWDQVQTDQDEDVIKLLPSSLHSLLTPQELHRQHLRKHAPSTCFSRSVPLDNLITSDSKKITHKPSSTLSKPPILPHTLSISPPSPILNLSNHHSNLMIRPQPTSFLSSSYIPPISKLQSLENSSNHPSNFKSLSPPLTLSSHKEINHHIQLSHAPGSSLPQGLAAGLSRLHFQPPLPTGLTPCGSPLTNHRDLHPLSPPRSPTSHSIKLNHSSSHRFNNLNLGYFINNNSSPLSRNVSYSPDSPPSQTLEEDDTPFQLEM
ncbi:hypothetical protein O181_010413, partial [Austropuccinia psidii MF-1]|nr:hypothetical protein [Austropuccinia psidii MF-1]